MKIIIVFLSVFTFVSCSIFQTTEQKEEKEDVTEYDKKIEEVYVFDDVSENESNTEEIDELKKEVDKSLQEKVKQEVDIFDEPIVKNDTPQQSGSKYFLQLGAFTSLGRAEKYVEEIKNTVPFKLSIIFNPNNTYYTVRSKTYTTRKEVEEVRAKLWSNNLFKDAFIITE